MPRAGWIHEIKFDGYRIQTRIENGDATLKTRRGLDWTDMQRMFWEDTPWKVTWMPSVFDEILEIANRYPERTIFTRFIPPSSPEEMPGMWQAYYEKWPMMTSTRIDPGLVDLVPELKRLVPPATASPAPAAREPPLV